MNIGDFVGGADIDLFFMYLCEFLFEENDFLSHLSFRRSERKAAHSKRDRKKKDEL